MNTIWYLSKERNLIITGFNRIEKQENGKTITELWITETNGKSKKIATGKQAIELEQEFLNMVWGNFPAIVCNGNGSFGSNISNGEAE